MKILLVKTTSMGDLFHVMPAITDLQKARPDIELHWLVEEGFKEIPLWHPFIKKVHLCAIRRWRKQLLLPATWKEISTLKQSLQQEEFDAVIDAQGLIKSAWMVRWFDCERHGYDKASIKEPLAARVYTQSYSIPRRLPAIERNRRLFASAFAYSFEENSLDFGLHVGEPENLAQKLPEHYVVFLHGSNWESKLWPLDYWRQLAKELSEKGMPCLIAWGDHKEKDRAEAIAEGTAAVVLDRQPLGHLAYLLQRATAVVGCDTGLSHLAAALGTETIALYGSTDASLTGLIGNKVHNLQSTKSCSPCMKRSCPLIKGDEMIPCYESIGVQSVIKFIS